MKMDNIESKVIFMSPGDVHFLSGFDKTFNKIAVPRLMVSVYFNDTRGYYCYCENGKSLVFDVNLSHNSEFILINPTFGHFSDRKTRQTFGIGFDNESEMEKFQCAFQILNKSLVKTPALQKVGIDKLKGSAVDQMHTSIGKQYFEMEMNQTCDPSQQKRIPFQKANEIECYGRMINRNSNKKSPRLEMRKEWDTSGVQHANFQHSSEIKTAAGKSDWNSMKDESQVCPAHTDEEILKLDPLKIDDNTQVEQRRGWIKRSADYYMNDCHIDPGFIKFKQFEEWLASDRLELLGTTNKGNINQGGVQKVSINSNNIWDNDQGSNKMINDMGESTIFQSQNAIETQYTGEVMTRVLNNSEMKSLLSHQSSEIKSSAVKNHMDLVIEKTQNIIDYSRGLRENYDPFKPADDGNSEQGQPEDQNSVHQLPNTGESVQGCGEVSQDEERVVKLHEQEKVKHQNAGIRTTDIFDASPMKDAKSLEPTQTKNATCVNHRDLSTKDNQILQNYSHDLRDKHEPIKAADQGHPDQCQVRQQRSDIYLDNISDDDLADRRINQYLETSGRFQHHCSSGRQNSKARRSETIYPSERKSVTFQEANGIECRERMSNLNSILEKNPRLQRCNELPGKYEPSKSVEHVKLGQGHSANQESEIDFPSIEGNKQRFTNVYQIANPHDVLKQQKEFLNRSTEMGRTSRRNSVRSSNHQNSRSEETKQSKTESTANIGEGTEGCTMNKEVKRSSISQEQNQFGKTPVVVMTQQLDTFGLNVAKFQQSYEIKPATGKSGWNSMRQDSQVCLDQTDEVTMKLNPLKIPDNTNCGQSDVWKQQPTNLCINDSEEGQGYNNIKEYEKRLPSDKLEPWVLTEDGNLYQGQVQKASSNPMNIYDNGQGSSKLNNGVGEPTIVKSQNAIETKKTGQVMTQELNNSGMMSLPFNQSSKMKSTAIKSRKDLLKEETLRLISNSLGLPENFDSFKLAYDGNSEKSQVPEENSVKQLPNIGEYTQGLEEISKDRERTASYQGQKKFEMKNAGIKVAGIFDASSMKDTAYRQPTQTEIPACVNHQYLSTAENQTWLDYSHGMHEDHIPFKSAAQGYLDQCEVLQQRSANYLENNNDNAQGGKNINHNVESSDICQQYPMFCKQSTTVETTLITEQLFDSCNKCIIHKYVHVKKELVTFQQPNKAESPTNHSNDNSVREMPQHFKGHIDPLRTPSRKSIQTLIKKESNKWMETIHSRSNAIDAINPADNEQYYQGQLRKPGSTKYPTNKIEHADGCAVLSQDAKKSVILREQNAFVQHTSTVGMAIDSYVSRKRKTKFLYLQSVKKLSNCFRVLSKDHQPTKLAGNGHINKGENQNEFETKKAGIRMIEVSDDSRKEIERFHQSTEMKNPSDMKQSNALRGDNSGLSVCFHDLSARQHPSKLFNKVYRKEGQLRKNQYGSNHPIIHENAEGCKQFNQNLQRPDIPREYKAFRNQNSEIKKMEAFDPLKRDMVIFKQFTDQEYTASMNNMNSMRENQPRLKGYFDPMQNPSGKNVEIPPMKENHQLLDTLQRLPDTLESYKPAAHEQLYRSRLPPVIDVTGVKDAKCHQFNEMESPPSDRGNLNQDILQRDKYDVNYSEGSQECCKTKQVIGALKPPVENFKRWNLKHFSERLHLLTGQRPETDVYGAYGDNIPVVDREDSFFTGNRGVDGPIIPEESLPSRKQILYAFRK